MVEQFRQISSKQVRGEMQSDAADIEPCPRQSLVIAFPDLDAQSVAPTFWLAIVISSKCPPEDAALRIWRMAAAGTKWRNHRTS